MALVFLLGFVCGVIFVSLLAALILLNPFGEQESVEAPQRNQFVPFRIPTELRKLLISPGLQERLQQKETGVYANLLTHFLYQQFRETRWFRRWVLNKLQMEFNELTSRSAVGRLLQEIRIRDLVLGSQFPVVRDIHVAKAQLSADQESFEEVDVVATVDYRGGFSVSIDVVALLGRAAFLSIQLTRIAGQVRLRFSRHPYDHWSLSFVQQPTLDFKVDSKFRGRPLKQIVPLIIQQLRRTVQKKHVLPNFKMRYRPFFVNPLLQPSANADDLTHIRVAGGLHVDVRCCSRLNVACVPVGFSDLYCVVQLSARPLLQGRTAAPMHYVRLQIKFMRHSTADDMGLVLAREGVAARGGRRGVVVQEVARSSAAARVGFRAGDIVLAVNNRDILTERHAARLIGHTCGELVVLVERSLENVENDDEISERLAIRRVSAGAKNDSPLRTKEAPDGFVHVDYDQLPDDNRSLADGDSSARMRSRSLPTLLDDELDNEPLRRSQSMEPSLDAADVAATFQVGDSEAEPTVPDMNGNGGGGGGGKHSPDSVSLASTASKSRRQRLTQRATDTATNVAQRWYAGKSTVKDMWLRRRRQSPATLSDNRVSVGSSNDSQRPQLRSTGANFKRSFSQSDLQTNELDVKLRDANKQPQRSSFGLSRNTSFNGRLNADDVSASTVCDVLERETMSVTMADNVSWNQTLKFALDERYRFINVSLLARVPRRFSSGGEAALKPVLVGYTSLLLAEALDDCSATQSHHHQQPYALRPPGEPNVPSRLLKYMSHPGFDARLCYGDVTLGFQWLRDGLRESGSEAAAADDEPVELVTPTDDETAGLLGQHAWTLAHFSQSIVCYVCKGRVWLKSASQCTRCSLICHNKCQPKASDLPCLRQLPQPAAQSRHSSASAADGAADEVAVEATEATHVAPTAESGRRKRLQKKFVTKLSNLRRRRPAGSDRQDQRGDADAIDMGDVLEVPAEEYFDSCGEDEASNGDRRAGDDLHFDAADPKHFHRMLYTAGGNFNEHVINAAKDLGRDLFSSYSLDERKRKINEEVRVCTYVALLAKGAVEIDKLQTEIDTTAKDRLAAMRDAHASNTADVHGQLRAEYNRLDDRLQALAVLMLHYCAGLQRCLDLEEEQEDAAAVAQTAEDALQPLDEESSSKGLYE